MLDHYNVAAATPDPFRTLPLEQQDPWESRRAWQGVLRALHAGDMQGVADAKSALENAQRAMRKVPELGEAAWRPLFFEDAKQHAEAEKLLGVVGAQLEPEKTCGVWRFRREVFEKAERPWRGSLTPHGEEKK